MLRSWPAAGTSIGRDRVEHGMTIRGVVVWLSAFALVTGCASSGGGAAAGPSTKLTVHIGIFGGPAGPDGEMAASNEPDAGARIVITDRAGNTQRAKTDADGIATFSVRPGYYSVSGPCTVGTRSVTVRSNRAAHVELRWDVP